MKPPPATQPWHSAPAHLGAQALPPELQKAWKATRLPLSALSLEIREAGGPVIARVQAVGRVETDAITELSGLAASRTRDGVFYTHNDSGDGARFFAIDRTGALLATYTLEGVDANDIEDEVRSFS